MMRCVEMRARSTEKQASEESEITSVSPRARKRFVHEVEGIMRIRQGLSGGGKFLALRGEAVEL